MLKLLLIILCLLTFPCKSYAFKFDVWESGISAKNANIIAYNNGITLKEVKMYSGYVESDLV